MKNVMTDLKAGLAFMVLMFSLVSNTLNAQNLNTSTNKTFTYDADGNLKSTLESQSFVDWRGRLLQNQSRVNSLGIILATQPIYDRFGRSVIETLPAPVGTSFGYSPNFVQGALGIPYDYTHFDLTSGTDIGGQYNPTPVFSIAGNPNTLGWYYSLFNDQESGVAVTQYPYTRTIYNSDGSNEVSLNTLPGDAHKLDINSSYRTGRQLHTRVFPIGQSDLVEYINLRNEVVSMQNLIDAKASMQTNHIVGDKEIPTDITDYENQTFYIAPGASLRLAPGFDSNGARFTAVGLSPHDYLSLTEQGTHELTRDPNGKEVHTFKDISGQVIATAYSGVPEAPVSSLEGWAYYMYDDNQRLVASISPNGVEQWRTGIPYSEIDKTVYEYNHRGWLLSSEESDGGKTEYMYRKDGKVRFSRNSEQRINSIYSYTLYDQMGRSIESGEIANGAEFNSDELHAILENSGIQALPSGGSTTDWFKTHYDLAADNIELETGLQEIYSQDFLLGQVSSSENQEVLSWYSYDDLGQVTWILQKPRKLDKAFAIEYVYDFSGNVLEKLFKEYDTNSINPLNIFEHRYSYDLDQRLFKVETRLNGSIEADWKVQAEYEYFIHGPLKRIKLRKNLQGIDYRYTAQGWLKAINHPENDSDPGNDGGTSSTFRKDAFGMLLEYYDGDYNTANNTIFNATIDNNTYPALFDGNIRGQSWKTPLTINRFGASSRAYMYNYDDQYQLVLAHYGNVIPDLRFLTVGSKFKLDGISYDANGNLKSLQRYDQDRMLMDDFTYNYTPNSNQLQSIDNHASYTYNSIGQMTEEQKTTGEEQKLIYDVTGKVTEVRDENNNLKVAFDYDDRGFRLSKTVYLDQSPTQEWTTWYIRDVSGALLATYDNKQTDGSFSTSTSLKELPIYGASKLGIVYPQKNEVLYELNDHLGNVRATVAESTQGPTNYLATFEDNLWPGNEENNFDLNTAMIVDDGSGNKVSRVSAGENSIIGASKMLLVMPGDAVSVSIEARIESSTTPVNVTPPQSILSTIFSALVSDPIAAESFSNNAFSGGNASQIASLIPNASDNAAYINYLLYDTDFNFITGGYQAASVGSTMGTRTLEIPSEIIQTPGFLFIYTSNESRVEAQAYFDDFSIDHTQGIFRSAADYYPFGLEIDPHVFSVINPDNYRFGYQGQFAEKDEETGWNAFELRMYDPAISRWISMDPFRQHSSPYLSMSNNHVNRVDPNGGIDWYQNDQTGELEWINGSAQIDGYTYLGEDLTFSFSSFIDRADWDGPNPWFDVSGEKLFNSVTLDFNQDVDGNLLGLVNVSYESQIMTNDGGFTGVAWKSLGNYQIGAGGRGLSTKFTAGFEKHAGVPFVEAMGLWIQGYARVNVAQQLLITGNNGKINYKASTDIFPSASLYINGTKVMHYRQPLYRSTHGLFSRPSPTLYQRQGISFKRGGR